MPVHITGVTDIPTQQNAVDSFRDAIEANVCTAPLLLAEDVDGGRTMLARLHQGPNITSILQAIASTGTRCTSAQLCAVADVTNGQAMMVFRVSGLSVSATAHFFERTPDGVMWFPGQAFCRRPELIPELVALTGLLRFAPRDSN